MGDIEAYCGRIGYSGSLNPTLATLQAIVAGHTAAIPFENLDVLLKRPIRLDLPSLREKLVHRQRGGYCFEHNLLLLDVLLTLGFSAAGLAARVQLGRPPGVVGARTHMLLRVELAEGPYLADAGFGRVPIAPLPLEMGTAQNTPHETVRLVPAGRELDLQAKLGETWSGLYRLSLQEQMAADYEVANWYTSTHPNSLFVRSLVVSRPGPDHRHTLFNDKLTIRHDGGKVEKRTLRGAREFGEALIGYFGVVLEHADVGMVAELAEERAAHPDTFDIG